jgi:hypothetical protein
MNQIIENLKKEAAAKQQEANQTLANTLAVGVFDEPKTKKVKKSGTRKSRTK